MRVEYMYMGKRFSDLRDIVENNEHLRPDYAYLFEEYLPFQVFITGRTAYRGVFIAPTVQYDPENVSRETFCYDAYKKSVDSYIKRYGYTGCKVTAGAVSGGVDSSSMAVLLKPKVIYSGFYKGDEYDETEYSSSVAKAIKAKHFKIELFENDFIDYLEEYSRIVIVPSAGMGGVMEYALLQKFLGKFGTTDGLLFGNGGDEIFCAYFFNRYLRHFAKHFMDGSIPYYENFFPSQTKISTRMLDFMLVECMNRGESDVMNSPFVLRHLIPRLSKLTLLQKMLLVNINMTLPSLLHVNQQICAACGIAGFNPIANRDLIAMAGGIRWSNIPKEEFRKVNPDLPEIVRLNRVKRGFPMPFHKWEKAKQYMAELYHSFRGRNRLTIPSEFPGINRFTWGIAQVELFLRRFH